MSAKQRTTMPPKYPDEVILACGPKATPPRIARAIAQDERFLGAIQRGLEAGRNRPEKVIGPAWQQLVRVELERLFADG